MKQDRSHSGDLRALVLAAVLGFAPGCTYFDTFFTDTPFTPDQPDAQVTVLAMHVERASGTSVTCPAGGTIFWGTAKNTGDLDVDDVSVVIEAFNAQDEPLLQPLSAKVFNGEVVAGPEGDSFSTSLAVDQSGIFEICTTLRFDMPAERAVRQVYHTTFRVPEVIVTQ